MGSSGLDFPERSNVIMELVASALGFCFRHRLPFHQPSERFMHFNAGVVIDADFWAVF